MAVISSISSGLNFNGTSIPNGNWIWFNSHLSSVQSVGTTYHLYVKNATVTIVDGANSLVINIPDTTLTFSPGASDPVYAGTTAGQWTTTYKDGSGNGPFISGAGIQWNQTWDPAGANPVTWSADFSTDSSVAAGLQFQWQCSAAVYTSFSSDISAVNATALDGAGGYSQSGTPSTYATYVTGGAKGGGGSNYTGSNSGTVGFTPTYASPVIPEQSTVIAGILLLLPLGASTLRIFRRSRMAA